MVDIVAPVNCDDAVVLLPDLQTPYGNCVLPRDIQSILFRHGISPVEVDTIIEEGIDDASMFREANPDGNDEQQRAFRLSVEDKIVKPVRLNRMRRVFRRILSANPMAAVADAAQQVQMVLLAPLSV